MFAVGRTKFRNRLLVSLPARELNLLAEHLEPVALPRRNQLEVPNRRIEHLYFVESGIVSVVAATADSEIEIGVIGYEGMTGHPVLHFGDRGPYSAYMQVEGEGHRIETPILAELMRQNEAYQRIFISFTRAFTIQVCETAVANARGTIPQRLARWLLMTQDRVVSNEIPLTHEFLAVMIGTRRPGVTEATHELARQGLIDNSRGKITIVDRKGLERLAGRFYGIPESEYSRLVAAVRATSVMS
jgi:CRP-like cAMP-binding protein